MQNKILTIALLALMTNCKDSGGTNNGPTTPKRGAGSDRAEAVTSLIRDLRKEGKLGKSTEAQVADAKEVEEEAPIEDPVADTDTKDDTEVKSAEEFKAPTEDLVADTEDTKETALTPSQKKRNKKKAAQQRKREELAVKEAEAAEEEAESERKKDLLNRLHKKQKELRNNRRK